MTVIIGIDPHKATHIAVAIDGDEHADRPARGDSRSAADARLLAWAEPLGRSAHGRSSPPVGSASCCPNSSLAAGEHVVDVPPTLAARVRLLGSRRRRRTTGNDALSTAIAGLRHCGLRTCP